MEQITREIILDDNGASYTGYRELTLGVKGEYGTRRLKLVRNGQWVDFDSIVVTFTNADNDAVSVTADANNIVTVPWEACQTPDTTNPLNNRVGYIEPQSYFVVVGVKGTTAYRPTAPVVYRVPNTGNAIGDNAQDPTPTVYQQFVADCAASAATATAKASAASASATTASSKASEAATSATTASSKASESATSAQTATTAKNDAVNAKNTAVSAKNTAVSASTTATAKAGEAASSATAAETAASTATAKADEATEAAESIEASAEQIATNTANIEHNKHSIAYTEERLQNVIHALDGIAYREIIDSSEAQVKNVAKSSESGVLYTEGVEKWADLTNLGGKSIVADGNIISAEVDKVLSKKTDSTIIQTLNIPAAIRQLGGYGWSAGSVCNEIDFTNKKFIKRVAKVDMGMLTWIKSATYVGVYQVGRLQSNGTPSRYYGGLTLDYGYQTGASMATLTDKHCYLRGVSSSDAVALFVCDNDYADATAAEFKAAMSGKMLYYELTEPVITDISAYLEDDTQMIQVEGGGTIEFHRPDEEYTIDIPSTIVYDIDISQFGGTV